MSKVKVLFFAADPLSAPPNTQPRLLLDEDVRRIREKVRLADHRDALEFDWRPAAHPDDLIQAWNEARPQVVHFSGHGGSEGLVLVGEGGLPHRVGTRALSRLFTALQGDIRLVVLNACFSQPQAEAIAESVGCAIGTRGRISDGAATTFGAALYSAIAFGHSVQAAFDQARAALSLEYPLDEESPVLVARPGADPAALVLVHPHPLPASPDGGVAEDGGRRTRWSSIFLAVVWLSSLGGSLALVGNAAAAVALSLVSLAISAALLRFTRFPARSGMASAGTAGAALVLSALSVVAVAELIDGQPAEGPGAIRLLREQRPPADPRDADSIIRSSASFTATEDSGGRARGADPAVGSGALPANAPTRDAGAERELAAARQLFEAKNYADAHPIFERLAAAGDTQAMGYLGILYLEGKGTAKREDLAIPLLRRAAQAGDPRGMHGMGVAHQHGRGVDRNYPEAMRWFLEAAQQGFAGSMNNVGELYRRGLGVGPDPDKALSWYLKAAEAGSLDGMVNAGLVHELGLTGTRDMAQALRWYRNAADAGASGGMVQLGKAYQNGNGVERDYAAARVWYLKAVEAGDAAAMNNVGVLYHNGWGVPRDREEAIRWFRRAAEAGSTEAAGNLDALGGR